MIPYISTKNGLSPSQRLHGRLVDLNSVAISCFFGKIAGPVSSSPTLIPTQLIDGRSVCIGVIDIDETRVGACWLGRGVRGPSVANTPAPSASLRSAEHGPYAFVFSDRGRDGQKGSPRRPGFFAWMETRPTGLRPRTVFDGGFMGLAPTQGTPSLPVLHHHLRRPRTSRCGMLVAHGDANPTALCPPRDLATATMVPGGLTAKAGDSAIPGFSPGWW